MLKYPCLVLDHDDTVVQSESTVNYPFFVDFLKEYRPGATISLEEYVNGCFDPGYIQMCRQRFDFTEEELLIEYNGWKEQIIRQQKKAGGLICVVSQSSNANILRDYKIHFGIEPDEIFGWDLAPEHRKPSPYALKTIMEKYQLSPAQLLVVDDMKPACEMARSAGVEIAFAGWGRKDFPKICTDMDKLCDFSFYSTESLYDFLFA